MLGWVAESSDIRRRVSTVLIRNEYEIESQLTAAVQHCWFIKWIDEKENETIKCD